MEANKNFFKELLNINKELVVGKEYELRSGIILRETSNKYRDGSGPFELKTKKLSIAEAIVTERLLNRIFNYEALYDYYIRDDGETEEKGNHFHFSLKEEEETKKLALITSFLFLTPLRKLLTMNQNRFRNNFRNWNRYYFSWNESRNYTLVTRNGRNGMKPHAELRASEGALMNDLLYLQISLAFYLIHKDKIDFGKLETALSNFEVMDSDAQSFNDITNEFLSYNEENRTTFSNELLKIFNEWDLEKRKNINRFINYFILQPLKLTKQDFKDKLLETIRDLNRNNERTNQKVIEKQLATFVLWDTLFEYTAGNIDRYGTIERSYNLLENGNVILQQFNFKDLNKRTKLKTLDMLL